VIGQARFVFGALEERDRDETAILREGLRPSAIVATGARR
jgi:hypothetical protein